MALTNRVLLATVACLIALGCSRTKGDEELSRAIVAKAQEGGGDVTVADVPGVTQFSWDRVHIFPPNTPADKVRQELGFDWPEAGRVAKHDDLVLLVFLDQGKVVRFVDLPRSAVDLAPAARQGGYNHSDAVFRCTKQPSGPRRCALATGS
jgi:hypothetical protein